MIAAGLVPAGSLPAAVKLGCILSIRRPLDPQSLAATHSALICTSLPTLPALPKHLCTPLAFTSPAPLPCSNPHSRLRHRSPAAPPAYYLPTRFRALALFGRRPPQRIDAVDFLLIDRHRKAQLRANRTYDTAARCFLGAPFPFLIHRL